MRWRFDVTSWIMNMCLNMVIKCDNLVTGQLAEQKWNLKKEHFLKAILAKIWKQKRFVFSGQYFPIFLGILTHHFISSTCTKKVSSKVLEIIAISTSCLNVQFWSHEYEYDDKGESVHHVPKLASSCWFLAYLNTGR